MWTIPRLWPGATVAVLASGPSMSKAIADSLEAAPNRPKVIAVNDTAKLAPWADMIYAADGDWWRLNRWADQLLTLKVGMCQHPGVLELAISRRTLERGADRHNGFDEDPSRLRTGGNSGYQAISVAVHADAARVLLFGFDMHGTHWHGEHPAPLRNTHPDTFAVWLRRFDELAPMLAQRGVDVVNCTPGSALTCFRTMTPDEAIACAQ